MPAAQDPGPDASGGGIFQGIKFWLSHRIPDRANAIALVKGNGGLIEAYDKRADILIADHARRDAPPNSFSWRLITESAKAGQLLDKEAHRIGRPLTEPRPIASHEPTRSRRMPYTPADDAILAAWVGRSAQQSGNRIYQELEIAYPHHTWHSWRNRWLKHVRLLPPDVLDRMTEFGASNCQAPAAPASSTSKRRTPATPASDTSNGRTPAAAASNRPRHQRQMTPPPTRQPALAKSSLQPLRPSSPSEREVSPAFDDDDDVILERYVKRKVEAGERWNSISIYEELEKEYPQHSADSWKQHFAELWRDNRVNMKNWNSTNRSTTQQSCSPSLAGSEPRGLNGDTARTEENESSHQDATSPSQQSPPDTSDAKATFHQNYTSWINLEAGAGRTREVKIWHYIQGRKFELWDLYEAILGQECPIDDVKWELVAQKLNFEATSMPHAAEELEGCWDKYLSKFYEDTSGFDFSEFDHPEDDNASTEEGDGVSGGEDVSGVDDVSREEDIPDDADIPTPQIGHPSPSLSNHSRSGSLHRKRRLDRGAEIPASPQTKAKPVPGHGANKTASSKRIRLANGTDKRRAETSTDGDEDIYYGTPTRNPSVPQEPDHTSPLSVRTRYYGSATPGPSTARRHTRHTNAASIRTPSPHLAPKRRTLPPVIAPEPEPEPHPVLEYNDADEEDNSDEVQATVEQLVRQGYPRPLAIESLYRTSLVPSLARTVLASLHRGDGVPERAGVWTAQDDEKLRDVDTEDMNRPTENLTEQSKRRQLTQVLGRLVKKHGRDNVEARRRFLADAKEAGFSL